MTKSIKHKKVFKNTNTKKNKQTNIEFKSFETIRSSNDSSSYENNIKKVIKLLKTQESPQNLAPNQDFYTYVNYLWLKNTQKNIKYLSKKEKYFVQIDDYRMTQNKVYIQLFEIIRDYIKNNPHSKKTKCISNVYTSLLNLDSKPIKKHIKDLIDIIEYFHNYPKPTQSNSNPEIITNYNAVKTAESAISSTVVKMYKVTNFDDLLWELLAKINQNQIISFACPINWQVIPDEKNSTIFRNYVSLPELSLYDANFYLPNEGQTKDYIIYKNKVIKEYLKYIDKIFDACLGKHHGLKAQDVFDVEYDILSAMGCDSVKNDSPDFYNIVKADESLEKYGFDWHKFSFYLGYKKVPDFFICDSLNYLKCIMDTLKKNFLSQKWKSYWYYIHLRQLIRFDKNLRHIYYDFNNKFLKGQPEMFPRELYPIFGLSYTFNTFLTEQYISKYKNDAAVEFVKILGYDLITVFKNIIKRNTWLSQKSKKAALEKLDHLKLVVAEPESLREDPLLDYSPDDAWSNLLLISRWKINKFLQLQGNEVIDIPNVDWKNIELTGYQAYIVNAFYTPISNSIYVPLAYIQKPFVDMGERGMEYELAHIGFVLGHEMSHSLDNKGSKYDYSGNLKDWWTPQDKKHYESLIKNIQQQYEVWALRDGIKFDASLGIGEDMADISGLRIVIEYLGDFQEKNNDIIQVRSLSYQALFTYYAIQYREHIYKKALQAQLKTNPHPLDKYRTNVPLSRSKIFRTLFNVEKGDDMFWSSTNQIW
jgi:putative endopeptidase